jgi:hypothetical protein
MNQGDLVVLFDLISWDCPFNKQQFCICRIPAIACPALPLETETIISLWAEIQVSLKYNSFLMKVIYSNKGTVSRASGQDELIFDW